MDIAKIVERAGPMVLAGLLVIAAANLLRKNNVPGFV